MFSEVSTQQQIGSPILELRWGKASYYKTMSWDISSSPKNLDIDLINPTMNSTSNCLEWRLSSRSGHPALCAHASQQMACHKPCGFTPKLRALTLQHLLLQGGHRNSLRGMEQTNFLSLGPGLQQLSLSVSEFYPRQSEEDPRDSSFHLNIMDGIRQAIATFNQVTSEVKVYLSRTYSAVCSIADQNKEQNMEFKYIHSRLSCVESRLDDIKRNTIELLGKVDSIKEDLSTFISKTQFSQVQEVSSVNQGMLEAASFL